MSSLPFGAAALHKDSLRNWSALPLVMVMNGCTWTPTTACKPPSRFMNGTATFTARATTRIRKRRSSCERSYRPACRRGKSHGRSSDAPLRASARMVERLGPQDETLSLQTVAEQPGRRQETRDQEAVWTAGAVAVKLAPTRGKKGWTDQLRYRPGDRTQAARRREGHHVRFAGAKGRRQDVRLHGRPPIGGAQFLGRSC